MIATLLAGLTNGCDDHMSGGWWWVMGLGWLVFLGAIAYTVYAVIRGRHASAAPGPSPGDVLAERFARGEIDADEYRARRDVLRG